MDGASGYIKSSPLLVSQPFFYFRCSHISWRRWRERIWAPVSSGWVRGRTSLPAHGYWMEGEGESSVQAVQSHICTRWTCLLGGWTSGFGATHSMAVLQVFQAKMLTSEEGGLDADSLRDLRRQTWLYAPPSHRRSMSSLIVLERHLWLTITEMKEADKVPFLDAPVSSGSLFGPAVEGFAERFTEAQK